MGEVHARAIHGAGGLLSAVAASSPERAAAAARRFHADRPVDTAEELVVADDVDVVHICTPNHLHVPLALKALEAGKHVICEKPLAVDVGGAARLVDAAAQTGAVVAVPFVYRFYPTVRDARQRVATGQAGALHLLHGSYLQDWLSRADDRSWRLDPDLGGASRAFGDIGVHWCDLVEFCSGHRITRLVARTLVAVSRPDAGPPDGPGGEDVATLLFETDKGALGSLVVSQVTPGRKNRLWLSLDGADASLAFDQELPDSLWIGSRAVNTSVVRGSEGTLPDSRVYDALPVGHPHGYQDSFTAFVADVYEAVAGRMPDGLPTFADGLRSAVITDAVLRSAVDGEWIEVA
jgi:predicted dehydrogenase